MEFKLKIHNTFYIFLFFIIYFNGFFLFVSYFISLIIHELSHYLVSKTTNNVTKTLFLYPYGMNIDVNLSGVNHNKKKLIFLIGPLINILLLLIIVSLWWAFPVLYFYTREFAFANLCLGFFNLIPLYPLDGGNFVLELLRSYKLKIKALKIMKIVAIIFAVFFLVLFLISCFYSLNFSCFCISFFLFSTIFSHKQYVNSEIENMVLEKNIKEYRAYVITLKTKYEEIKKCFNDNFFVQFYIVNDENKIIKVLSQQQLKKLFNNEKVLSLK